MQGVPTRGRALVSAWLDRFQGGETSELEWLLTRPFTFEDPHTDAVLDRWDFVRFAGVLAQAFPGWRFEPSRTEVHAHRVEIRARIVGQHTGPLDLEPLDGPFYPATGRGFRLPEQTFAWEIVHGRVHRFEVLDGPGIGPEAIIAKLGLTADHVRAPGEQDGASKAALSAPSEGEPSTPRKRGLAARIDRAVLDHRRRKRRQRVWRG